MRFPSNPWGRLEASITDRLADKLFVRLEQENALPLPERLYDVVVDDPDMAGRHEFRAIAAVSPLAAGVSAYRKAMRAEGFRCMASMPAGDEVTVSSMGLECGNMWPVVHEIGKHPQITYKPVIAP